MTEPTIETFYVWNVFKRRPLGTVAAETHAQALKLACATHPRTPLSEIFVTPTKTNPANH